jgi:hypothetical protein
LGQICRPLKSAALGSSLLSLLVNPPLKALVLSVAHLEKLAAIPSMLLNLFAYMSNFKPESNLRVVNFVIINILKGKLRFILNVETTKKMLKVFSKACGDIRLHSWVRAYNSSKGSIRILKLNLKKSLMEYSACIFLRNSDLSPK